MEHEIFASFDAEKGARLVEAIGSSQFAPLLLREANSISDVDEIFGYLVKDGAEPEPIISSSLLSGCDDRVDSYVQRFYQNDPAVHEFRSFPAGQSFVLRIPLTDILPHDYRRECFTTPGFAEKLSYGWRGKNYMLVLSFYRINSQDQRALKALSTLVALIIPMMVRHHGPVPGEVALVVIERRLARSYPALTDRERQVCARTILGRSAKDIASELRISAGTVLTYRQRAYQRSDVSRAGEMIPDLLN